MRKIFYNSNMHLIFKLILLLSITIFLENIKAQFVVVKGLFKYQTNIFGLAMGSIIFLKNKLIGNC